MAHSPENAPQVLIVDDDRMIHEVLHLMFTDLGFAVASAVSGDEALLRLANDHITPTTILIDLHMPGTTGGTLARALRERCSPETKLILMSASHPSPDQLSSYDHFLLKPISMPGLRAALGNGPEPAVEAVEPSVEVPKVLNQGVYETFAATVPPEKLSHLYRIALEEADRGIQLMQQAADADDVIAYRRAAHTIKGGCAFVGAEEMAKLAGGIEGRSTGLVNVLDDLKQLTEAFTRLRRIIVSQQV